MAPVGGYRGTENRLYRIEVHNGGGAGEATIKWSRDNGAVATAITGPIANATTKPIVTVQRLGRDDVLRFGANDWVELLDDAHELDGMPGVIAQVDSIDVSQSTVTLTAPLTDTIDPQRNPRLRRWDQTDGLDRRRHPDHDARNDYRLENGVNVKLELATRRRRCAHRRLVGVRSARGDREHRGAPRRTAAWHPPPLRPPGHRRQRQGSGRLPGRVPGRLRVRGRATAGARSV